MTCVLQKWCCRSYQLDKSEKEKLGNSFILPIQQTILITMHKFNMPVSITDAFPDYIRKLSIPVSTRPCWLMWFSATERESHHTPFSSTLTHVGASLPMDSLYGTKSKLQLLVCLPQILLDSVRSFISDYIGVTHSVSWRAQQICC